MVSASARLPYRARAPACLRAHARQPGRYRCLLPGTDGTSDARGDPALRIRDGAGGQRLPPGRLHGHAGGTAGPLPAGSLPGAGGADGACLHPGQPRGSAHPLQLFGRTLGDAGTRPVDRPPGTLLPSPHRGPFRGRRRDPGFPATGRRLGRHRHHPPPHSRGPQLPRSREPRDLAGPRVGEHPLHVLLHVSAARRCRHHGRGRGGVRPRTDGEGGRVPLHVPGRRHGRSRGRVIRYARHLALPGVGPGGQARLGEARVLIVGAGGLGSPAALYLAAAGVGTLGIVDPDRVELSNLQRQILHGTPDVGRLKTASAAERLSVLNPEVRIEPHPVQLDASNASELLGAYDLVVDGSDNFPTRYIVNDAALEVGIPWVYGAVLRWEGQLAIFAAPGGPCYRCLFRDAPPEGAVPGCAEAGVMGALPGVVGSLQALEAIKWIVAGGPESERSGGATRFESAVGRLLVFDTARLRMREVRPRRDPACPACGEARFRRRWVPARASAPAMPCPAAPDSPPSISPEELRTALEGLDPPLLVDVRSPWEWEVSNLAALGAIHLPPHLLDDPAALPPALDEGRSVVVMCRAGGRSLAVAERLRSLGFPRVSNLSGGLVAWARAQDPGLPVA
ncbi:MAG: molybdopterin-synthase adenylyltransferase MoeB [Gemmatimonadales bacterium]|nr:MAG: molybdopterin-synthase adenylyltransferase MoeB [Gemmatimonadales bacterium]